MAIATGEGELLAADGDRVGGGPCALVQRRGPDGEPVVHGTCVLQRVARQPTPIDVSAEYRLRLAGRRDVAVRIVRHSLSACGPEIVRFEGPGSL